MKTDFVIQMVLMFVMAVGYSAGLSALKYFGKFDGSWIECFMFLLIYLALLGLFTIVVMVKLMLE
ncbi:hypothetical protein CRG49_002110 [Neisseria sp. N95_16]|nr:hypothetical protein CRG49_002110 [Neisseria sp. N95_16]